MRKNARSMQMALIVVKNIGEFQKDAKNCFGTKVIFSKKCKIALFVQQAVDIKGTNCDKNKAKNTNLTVQSKYCKLN